MNDRIRAIISKEWTDLLRNRVAASTLFIMPIVITVLACVQMGVMSRIPLGKESAKTLEGMPKQIAELTSDPREALLLMMTYTALMMFSLVPAVLPSVLAAHSIVGEKQANSLEPLLATPIRTWELLTGKIAAIVLPSMVPAYIGYVAYVIVAVIVAPPTVVGFVLSPAYLLSVVLISPLLSVFGVTFGIMVSSRAADLQSAQALSGIIVLPVLGVGMAQLFGAVALTVASIVWRALGIAVVDVALVLLCVSLFERETILGRKG